MFLLRPPSTVALQSRAKSVSLSAGTCDYMAMRKYFESQKSQAGDLEYII